jgi:hypothetical protein
LFRLWTIIIDEENSKEILIAPSLGALSSTPLTTGVYIKVKDLPLSPYPKMH